MTLTVPTNHNEYVPMRNNSFNLSLVLASGLMANVAFAGIVANEDFDGGASGWSNNKTSSTTFDGSSITVLGNFGGTGGAQSLYKDFALPGTQTQATINFDLFEFDSWDGRYGSEGLLVFIDNTLQFQVLLDHNRRDDLGSKGAPGTYVTQIPAAPVLDWSTSITAPASGNTNIGGWYTWQDQSYNMEFVVSTSSTSLRLGFGAITEGTLTSPGDESWGIDNLLITDNSQPGGGGNVPLPGTLALLTLGVVGLGFRSRKAK